MDPFHELRNKRIVYLPLPSPILHLHFGILPKLNTLVFRLYHNFVVISLRQALTRRTSISLPSIHRHDIVHKFAET